MRSTIFPLVVLVVAFTLTACSKNGGRKQTFLVSGKVLDGSKPVAHATVVFHPLGGDSQDVPKPRGKTDESGVFQLTTYDGNDGAPAGEYRVTVELWLAGKPDEGPSSRLAPKFARPDASGLHATVNPASTELQPFRVTR